jgi:5-aminolevulinate synthase
MPISEAVRVAVEARVRQLKQNQGYRWLFALDKSASLGPTRYRDVSRDREVDVWCTNDYLGQSVSPSVISAATSVAARVGIGSGSVRSISGTTSLHVELENAIARFHRKEAGLVFNSGFICNESCLYILGKHIPNVMIFSDEKNHASMAHGIINSRAEKVIFRNNDVEHLSWCLAQAPRERPKIIAFESVYSMDGTVSPIAQIVELAAKHDALTYLDEVHAVGMYGPTGAGVSEQLGVQSQVDIVQGTFGKAFGTIGGYVATSSALKEFLVQHSPGFIFSTSMPAAVVAASLQSLSEVSQNPGLRERHQARVAMVRARLKAQGHVVMSEQSHIVPVYMGSAEVATAATRCLFEEHSIFVQAIKPPSVRVGEERLRVTPMPQHSEEQIDRLCFALAAISGRLSLPTAHG